MSGLAIGVAWYGRRRQVVLTPKPSRCPICGTDLETTTNCPDNCLTRTEEKP